MRKNTVKLPFSFILLTFLTFFSFNAKGTSPQVIVTFSDCDMKIKATIDPVSDGSSVGLFYRVEHINKGSYFFFDVIKTPNTTATTTTPEITLSNLPDGDYVVICYEMRKNGPIRTGNSGNKNLVGGSTCSNNRTLTLVDLSPAGNNAKVLLSPSWNIFSNPSFNYAGGCNHQASNDANAKSPSPSQFRPWFFLTLTVDNWKGNYPQIPAFLRFNSDELDYIGAVETNKFDDYPRSKNAAWDFVANSISETPASPGLSDLKIEPKPNVNPDNSQTHIHLIFEKINLNIPTEPYSFTASITDSVGNTSSHSINLPVKGNPHDPNRLDVDKDILCSCQGSQLLTYKIKFQNEGNAPAAKVEIVLDEDTTNDYLNYSSLQLIPNDDGDLKTSLKKANISYSPGSKTFTIEKTPSALWLPGLLQPTPKYLFHETEDYFSFKINDIGCIKKGTVIRPKAKILFYGGKDNNGSVSIDTAHEPPVFTNLEPTTFVTEYKVGDLLVSCPEPDSNCTNCKKKPCWLFSWLFPKKK